MNRALIYSAGTAAAIFLAGCETIPPGAERGPNHTMAYDVLVEASEPGARIEANGQDVGNTPLHLKIFGDPDGTFHDFGSPYYVIKALPLTTNQFEQARFFGTGHLFGPEDRIPQKWERTVLFQQCKQTMDASVHHHHFSGRDSALRCPRRVQRRNKLQGGRLNLIPSATTRTGTPRRGVPTLVAVSGCTRAIP